MYQCELCHKKFMKEANLKFHKENHDPGGNQKLYSTQSYIITF